MKMSEIERRKKISKTLKEYFKAEQGKQHRDKLREHQSRVMSNYYEYLKSINENNRVNNF
jgi:GTP cyclohydrolase I